MPGFGNLFDASSSSQANDSRQTAGDAAIQLRSQGQIKNAAPGASITDFSGARIATAPTISGNKGNVSYTYNDPNATQGLAASFTDAIKGLASQASDTFGTALQSIGTLAQGQQSGGQTYSNKTVQTVLLGLAGVAGVVLIVLFFRKR